jgi:hypothetical protein
MTMVSWYFCPLCDQAYLSREIRNEETLDGRISAKCPECLDSPLTLVKIQVACDQSEISIRPDTHPVDGHVHWRVCPCHPKSETQGSVMLVIHRLLKHQTEVVGILRKELEQ